MNDPDAPLAPDRFTPRQLLGSCCPAAGEAAAAPKAEKDLWYRQRQECLEVLGQWETIQDDVSGGGSGFGCWCEQGWSSEATYWFNCRSQTLKIIPKHLATAHDHLIFHNTG